MIFFYVKILSNKIIFNNHILTWKIKKTESILNKAFILIQAINTWTEWQRTQNDFFAKTKKENSKDEEKVNKLVARWWNVKGDRSSSNVVYSCYWLAGSFYKYIPLLLYVCI